MSAKISKPKTKNISEMQSVRITTAAKSKAVAILGSINKKKFGRKVHLDELIELSLSLVTDEYVKLLQEKSLSHEDRIEKLRHQYIERYGNTSRDNFLGFLLTPDFQKFKSEIQTTPNANPASAISVAHAG